MEVTQPFKLMLGRAILKGSTHNLYVKKLAEDTLYNRKEFFEEILSSRPFSLPISMSGISLDKRFLVVEILPTSEYHKKLEHEFSFKEFEVLTLIDGEPCHQPITLAQVRELIHDLSVSYNGKTFEERDFQKAVFMQTSIARDDNRNQDECYNDASTTILYLFVYGFIHHIMTSLDGSVLEKGILLPHKSVTNALEASCPENI